MSLEKEYRIVTIDKKTYYMIEKYPDGYILERYSSDYMDLESSKEKYPKHFNVYKYASDYFCKTKGDVLDFFSDNYNIELDTGIFK